MRRKGSVKGGARGVNRSGKAGMGLEMNYLAVDLDLQPPRIAWNCVTAGASKADFLHCQTCKTGTKNLGSCCCSMKVVSVCALAVAGAVAKAVAGAGARPGRGLGAAEGRGSGAVPGPLPKTMVHVHEWQTYCHG